MSERQCPKCKGRMVQGFIPDYSEGSILVGSWHEGPPRKSFWGRTKAPLSGGTPIGPSAVKDAAIWSITPTPSSRQSEVAEP